MYIGVDIGGTKTLVAVLDEHGAITEKTKLPTAKNYGDFLSALEEALASLKTREFKAGGVAIPGLIDRQRGRALRLGNLPWQDIDAQADMEKLCGCPVAIENDAKLAGLSEAMLLKNKYRSVLYVTISTGIGYGLVNNGVIDTGIGDGGGRAMLLEHKGKMTPWEDFAGGRAIAERYGKQAIDITDETTWRNISRDLAKGFIHLIAIIQPEIIVIGGAVGTYFDRYGKLLEEEIEKYKIPMVKLPALIKAQRPEEAVVYGCYDLAKQVYGNGKAAN